MREKIINNPYELPEQLGNMTIDEFIRAYDSEVHFVKGKACIKKKTCVGTMVLQIDFADEKRAISEAEEMAVMEKSSKRTGKKQDYWQAIQGMLAQGISQKEIAVELGISSGYVSQIVKKNSKKEKIEREAL